MSYHWSSSNSSSRKVPFLRRSSWEKGQSILTYKWLSFKSSCCSECSTPAPAVPQASPAFDVAAVLQVIHAQQQQMSQQNIIIQSLMSTLSVENKRPRYEAVKSDIFDGQSKSPEGWIAFFEHACEKKILNFRRRPHAKHAPFSWRSSQAMVRVTLN